MADDNVGQDVMNSISQPVRSIYERVTHIFGDPSSPSAATKPQQMNWKPEPNAEQQKYLDDKAAEEEKSAPAKTSGTKPLSQRTLGGVKRPAIKKPATTQTQRKQP